MWIWGEHTALAVTELGFLARGDNCIGWQGCGGKAVLGEGEISILWPSGLTHSFCQSCNPVACCSLPGRTLPLFQGKLVSACYQNSRISRVATAARREMTSVSTMNLSRPFCWLLFAACSRSGKSYRCSVTVLLKTVQSLIHFLPKIYSLPLRVWWSRESK